MGRCRTNLIKWVILSDDLNLHMLSCSLTQSCVMADLAAANPAAVECADFWKEEI